MLRVLVFSFLSLLFCSQVWATPAVTFDVTLSPAGDFTGKINKVEGSATKKGGKVMAENVKVPLKDLSTGIGLRDKHTKEHLEIEKYPNATLIKAEGENGKGKGTIEIHGVRKELSGTYEIKGKDLHAEFKINLSDFNITGISYKGIGVDDEVVIKVRIPLTVVEDDGAPKKSKKKSKKKK